ncbi:MAG: bifunctional methylenetetrahydrofolate dehydrogenase/methenyltetrahydrofolate cyclohydrolase FolD [Clostridia bacterium]|nr:bifunctional methylenetetrahydrofolate dehydrogenase/methenyltetrahydrofolate cyclohydrolase FolD [Clostridia bacterium]
MAIIIDGKAVAAEEKGAIKAEVADMRRKGLVPKLTVIIVGEDTASQIYVRNKKKACEDVGIESDLIELPDSVTENELIGLISKLNSDSSVSGILVQLPLPGHISENAVISSILPEKDVDAFHPVNVGKIMIGDHGFLPCTPAGIMSLLYRYGIDVSGKNCVVAGRSNIVGKPMAMLLLHADGTVTVCHSKTAGLKEICRSADVFVTAIGHPKFFTKDYIKPGAVVIDVGMNRDASGKLCGDVDFENVKDVASYITPVPGGVGPMTIVTLLKNTVTACKDQNAYV